jgi:hypothetical protein
MARHNRDAAGEDQMGLEYKVSYAPDWVQRIKVTRDLENRRQSTKTLFVNPEEAPKAENPDKVKTHITCEAADLDITVAVSSTSPVREINVETVLPKGPNAGEKVGFVIKPFSQPK